MTAITTPTTDTTPDYTFSSTGSGSITYGGSCSSSTTSATTGNNTITLNTLSVDTYADCTITVSKTIHTENSEKKLSGSLTITSFTVSSTVSSSDDSSSYSSGWQLIARQVDSDNFTDGTDELFSSNARSSFLQNENDNNSSTFMSIGLLTRSNYVTDGKYKFKLVWDGLQVDSLDNKSVTWTQTSWLTASTTQGFQEIGTSGFVYTTSSDGFRGLAKSTYSSCVIDGDGGTHSHWFNCVGTIAKWGGHSMPGPLAKRASSMHLYIWTPEIKETNYALDFDGTNDYVSLSDGSSLNFGSNQGFTVEAWVKTTENAGAIVSFRNSTNGEPVIYLSIGYNGSSTNDGKVMALIRGNGGGLAEVVGGSVNDDTWHHVALTRNAGNTLELYLDGVSQGTDSVAGANDAITTDLRAVGAEEYWIQQSFTTADRRYLDGKIDEVAVWNVALDAADVTSLYNSGNGLKASANSGNYDNSGDLVGYWKFNEGTGSTLTDNTSNSNNGTLRYMDNSSDWVTSGSETKPSFQ